MVQYFKDYALTLKTAGYGIIQVHENSKRPVGKHWVDKKLSPKQIKDICANGGASSSVGILTKNTPAIDLDIRDEDINKRLCDFILNLFDIQPPKRIGHAPKALFLFKTSEPFKKMASKKYEDVLGDLHQVEVLGDGQQFVSYGIHPDTEKPYVWSKTIPFKKDLPVLTREHVSLIIKEFERLAEGEGWEIFKRENNQPDNDMNLVGDDAEALLSIKDRADLSDEDIEDCISRIDGAEDHDRWVKVGMALHHQYEGDEKGLDIWNDWAIQSDKFNLDDSKSRWSSFGDFNKVNPTTFGSIRHWAKESDLVATDDKVKKLIRRVEDSDDWVDVELNILKDLRSPSFSVPDRERLVGAIQARFKSLHGVTLPKPEARKLISPKVEVFDRPGWLNGWVWLDLHECFFLSETGKVLSTKSFNANYNRNLKDTDFEGMPASEVALTTFELDTVENMLYRPMCDLFFEENGIRYINRYTPHPLPIPKTLSDDQLKTQKIFLNHVHNLIPDKRDAHLFIDFLAYCVQNPGDKIKYSVLLQGVDGDGKSYFAEAMGLILGADNINIINCEEIEERYTGWAANASMGFVEEVRIQGHNRFEILNKLKDKHTNDIVKIREIYGKPYKTVNTLNYVMLTNFKDAIPINDNDRRYFILFSRFQSKQDIKQFTDKHPDYFDDLYDYTRAHPEALKKLLMGWDFSEEFNAKKIAPLTQDREIVINESKDIDADDFNYLIESNLDIDICDDLLNVTKLQDLNGSYGSDFDEDGDDKKFTIEFPQSKTLSILLKKLGFAYLGRLKIDGKMYRFYSKNPSVIKKLEGKNLNDKIRKYLD